MERYEITGRVQDVGFRYWAVQTATALGIRGTVRNRPDGAVEVHADGEPDALRTFRRRLEEGPPGARVSEVRCLEPDRDGEIASGGFHVVR